MVHTESQSRYNMMVGWLYVWLDGFLKGWIFARLDVDYKGGWLNGEMDV